jgi:ferredoxin, 2Fe-2S
MEAGAKIRSSMGEAKLNLHNTIPSNHPARDTESRVPKAVFIQTDGSETTVDAARGESVMRAAVRSNVDGILAECGGSLTCSTCHVYVDEGWLARLEPIEQDEAEMLEYTAAERRPNSRLSCGSPSPNASSSHAGWRVQTTWPLAGRKTRGTTAGRMGDG